MLRGIQFLLVIASIGVNAQPASFQQLLRVDERMRSDSMNAWYKYHVRQLDSATAFATLDKLEHAAEADRNEIAIATVPYLRGQYYELKLKRPVEAGILYREAIDKALKAELDYEWAVFTFHLGIFYYFSDNIPSAVDCVLRANEKLKQIGYDRDRHAGWHLYHIAYIYYHLANYRESLKYLEEAANHLSADDEWLAMQIPNTSGLAYNHLGRYDSAFTFFDRTLQLATANNDSVWMGIAEGNKGEVYLKMKEYDKALASLQTNYEYLVRHPKGPSTAGTAMRAITAMAEVYVARKDADKALALLNEALTVFWPMADKTDYWRQAALYKAMADAYALKRDFGRAYYYKDLSMQVTDSIARRDDALGYIYVQQQLESEKHLAQIEVLNAQQRLERQRRNFLLLAIGLSGIIGFMFFNRYRLKQKKDRQIGEKENQLLQSEALRMQNNLENAQMLLDQYVENIQEKNELIDGLRKEFAKAEQLPAETHDQAQQLEYIQQLSDATLLTDDEWERFKELFGKVHKGFFVGIRSKIPDVTEAELRLLALIKLNISNKQIAHMLGISPSSVHTARYRLRKKMALKEDQQLAELI